MEEHSNTDKTPYLFNGKELDEETGLYYYGARYYDARISFWQSVDPRTERAPGWSGYNYTFGNPVRYTDPTGMWPDFNISEVVHTSLDVVGLVPGLGEIADDVNAVIYLAKGNYTDAALSAAAIIPAAGAAVTIAKIARKADKAITAVKAADKATGAIEALDKAKDTENALTAGGAYGKFDNMYDEAGNLLTNKNHLPTMKSFDLAGFEMSKYIGSANIMKVEDHKNFISTGSGDLAKAFRNAEAKLLKEGNFMGAFDLNANAMRKQFGNKYDKAIEAARTHFEKNVVPLLKKQME